MCSYRRKLAREEFNRIAAEVEEREKRRIAALPENVQSHKNAHLIAEIHRKECLIAKQDFAKGLSDEGLKTKLYEPRAGETPESAASDMRAAESAFNAWLETEKIKLSNTGRAKLRKYLRFQPHIDLTNAQVWVDCLARCWEIGLFEDDELIAPPPTTDPSTVELDPQARIDAAGPFGSREREAYERQRAKYNAIKEITTSPLWQNTVAPYVSEKRNILATEEAQMELFRRVTSSREGLTQANIVRQIVLMYPETANKEQQLEREMDRDANTLTSDAWKQKYGLRTIDVRGWAPRATQIRQGF